MFKEATLDFISKDPQIARQVVKGLEKEVVRLQTALAQSGNYDGQTGLLEEVEEWLIEREIQNDLLRNKLFGRSSEKRSGNDDKDAEATQNKSDRRKRVKPDDSGRGEVGKGLPLQTEEYTLENGSKCDCACQSPLKKVKQLEITHIVDYVPAKLIKRKIIRQKYRAKQCGCRMTAPGPTTLVDGGQYGIDLATEIVARKFQDHTPWERQIKSFLRDGIKLAGSTMWNLSKHVADICELVYEKIRKSIETGFYRHADETRWRIIEDVKNKKQYAWLFRDDRHAYFTIEDSRGQDIPIKVMGGASGVLIADDYSGYNKLVSENKLLRVQCWSHTRRKFKEIREHYPCVEVYLDLVAELYNQDRAFRRDGPQTAERRNAMCGPIIEAIDTWRKNVRCLPRSGLGGALAYMNDNWDGLILFLKDPKIPLDNNPAENGLRQLVLGRKNFMFNRSPEGARVCSILYSIAVSCAMNNVSLREYLRETIHRIRNCRGFQLPYEFAKNRESIDLI